MQRGGDQGRGVGIEAEEWGSRQGGGDQGRGVGIKAGGGD